MIVTSTQNVIFSLGQRNFTLNLNANWHPNSSSMIEWKTDHNKESIKAYSLKLRRVHCSEEGMMFTKWRKVTFKSVNLTRTPYKPMKTHVYHILLSNESSYEINLTIWSLLGKVTSVSVFLDSPSLRSPGKATHCS